MTAPILLDLSRLLGRGPRGAPTGIDRVEHAYAEQLLLQVPDRLRFVAIDKLDRMCVLPMAATRRFVAMIGAHWRGEPVSAAQLAMMARMIWVRALLRPGLGVAPSADEARPFYLLISHRYLHRRERLKRALAASQARLVVFVHDLIPIELPEYARPLQAELHLQRIRTVAALAEAIIVNSQATEQALQPYLEEVRRATPVLVAPLGVQPLLARSNDAITNLHDEITGPYFVYLSTIEPRKNHLMLLQIWRRLGETLGAQTPHLVLVGRRGWENENVIDMLERSLMVRQHVTEWTDVADARVAALLRGSRALLFPSFAEGFGLPVAEALAAGTPVICSDLPALREIAEDVPDYLDPLDTIGWMSAIIAYTEASAPPRNAQFLRMRGWQPPNWNDHLKALIVFIGKLPPLCKL